MESLVQRFCVGIFQNRIESCQASDGERSAIISAYNHFCNFQLTYCMPDIEHIYM